MDEAWRKRSANLELCRQAVADLPGDVRANLAKRFRETSMGVLPTKTEGIAEWGITDTAQAAGEIHKFAFLGRRIPKKFRDIIQPVVVSLRISGEEE
jgi:hypothetical protein